MTSKAAECQSRRGEKCHRTINNIFYTLEHYPVPEDLEWSTEDVLALIYYIKELEDKIKRHKKKNPWKTLPREIDKELYKLVEKGLER